jgi:hypothetical protein
LPIIPPPPVFSFKKVNGQLVKIPCKENNNNNNDNNSNNSENGDRRYDNNTLKNTAMLFESYWESEYPRLGESCYICTENNNSSNDNEDNNKKDDNSNNSNNSNNDKNIDDTNNNHNDKDNNNNNNTKDNIDILYGFNTWFNNSKPSEGWKIKPKKDKFTSILLSNIIQLYNEKDCDNDMTNSDESHTIISRYFDANNSLSDNDDDDNNEINDRKMLIENLKKKYDNNNNDNDNDSSNDNNNKNENESNRVGEGIRKKEIVRLNEDNDKGVEEGVKEGAGGEKEGDEEIVKNVNKTNDNTQVQNLSDEDKAEARSIKEKVETEVEIESSDDHILETSNDPVMKSSRIDECSGVNADISIKMNEKGDVLNDGNDGYGNGGELGTEKEVEVGEERDGREVKGGAEDKGRNDIGDKAGGEEGEVEEKEREESVFKENQMQVINLELEKKRNNIEMEIKNKTEEMDDEENDNKITESASNNSHSDNQNEDESESENENVSHQSPKHKKLENTESKKNKNNKSKDIVEDKTVILDDENSNLVYSRIHGYRILVPDKNDSKAFYKKILGGLKEVRIVVTYLRS